MNSWLAKNVHFGESLISRLRSPLSIKEDVDVSVYLDSFNVHWHQAWTAIQAMQESGCHSTEQINTVLNHVDQVVTLLCWELQQAAAGATARLPEPRLLHLFLAERVPERLLHWSGGCGAFEPLLCAEQLRVFEQLLSVEAEELLVQRSVLRPLTALLLRGQSCATVELQQRLSRLLRQLCLTLQRQPQLLSLFLELDADGSASRCVPVALLVELMHADGVVGQTARQALLLCMRLSADSPQLAQYIADRSGFCQVLAAGLSGLFSALPHQLPQRSVESEQLSELDAFLESLEFCDAVMQLGHPLITGQLERLVYQGFLVSVMCPALHQSSLEGVMAATAYLELCVRSSRHPALVRALLRLLLRHRHDGVRPIDALVQRIDADAQLAAATLSLLLSLLELNCEDVMLELVFRHLLPCSHLMPSQRPRLPLPDRYGDGARRLLAMALPLAPVPCQPSQARLHHTCLLYTQEVRQRLTACRLATAGWTYPYDGVTPSPAQTDRMVRRARADPRSPPGGAAGAAADEAGRGSRQDATGLQTESERWPTSAMDTSWSSVTSPVASSSPSAGRGGISLVRAGAASPSAAPTELSTSQALHESCAELETAALELGILALLPDESGASEPRTPSREAASAAKESPSEKTTPDRRVSDSESGASSGATVPPPAAESSAGGPSEPERSLMFSAPSTPAVSAAGASTLSSATATLQADESATISESSFASCEESASPADLARISALEDSMSEAGDLSGGSGQPASLQNPPTGEQQRAAVAENTLAVASAVTAGGPYGTFAGGSPATGAKKLDCLREGVSAVTLAASEALPKPQVPQPELQPEPQPEPDSVMACDDAVATAAAPSIGPFLGALLARLELATTNSLQLNVQLTAVVTRLSLYPQPLLRSLLLDPSVVLQPTVRSLVQTLGSLQHRIQLAARAVPDWPALLRWAHARLDPASEPAAPQAQPQAQAQTDAGSRRGFSLASRLKRTLASVNVNVTMDESPPAGASLPPPQSHPRQAVSDVADPPAEQRRLAVTAVLLQQWLTELAAVALEHAVSTERLVFPY